MNVAHALGLKDVGIFKDQTFEFPKGISYVYGLNRVNGKHSSNGNAAGKSFMFGQLSEILYDDPVVGQKNDRTRVGERVFSFTSAKGKKVVVRREAHSRSDRIEVVVDGKRKKATNTKAKALIAKHWPITQDEFNTFVHLDSRVPHPLVMGSSKERQRFFTSFFSLDKLDAERKIFAARYSALKKVKAAHAELLAAYETGKEDLLSPEDKEQLVEKLERWTRKVSKLQKANAEGQEVIRLLQFLTTAKDQLQELNTALASTWTQESFDEAVKTNEYEYNKAKKDLKDAEAYSEYKKDRRRYDEAYEQLPKTARKLIKKLGLKKAIRRCKKASTELEALLKANANELTYKREDVLKKIKKLKALEKVNPPEMELGEAETLVRAYEHQLEHAKTLKKGTCETCGSVVKIKDPAKVKERLAKVRAVIDRHEAAAAYQESRKELKEWRATLAIQEQVLPQIEALEPYAELVSELVNLPDEPEDFEGKALELKVMKRVWDEVKERRQLLEFFGPHMETVIAAMNLTKEQKELARTAASAYDEIADLQDRINNGKAKLEVHKTIRSRLRKMKDRLEEMKGELKDEESLKLLIEAYSEKQIKKMAVEAIGSRLMKIVNKYASLVFPEDYRFGFEWGKELSLTVKRRYGKKILMSDVRKLSGAESKLFTVVLVLALLSFVPSHKRSSLMILDEPTANFSRETIQSFHDLLPTLAQVIPSIVVITPKDEEVYDGAHNFTVVKESGQARIVEGHPSSFRNRSKR